MEEAQDSQIVEQDQPTIDADHHVREDECANNTDESDNDGASTKPGDQQQHGDDDATEEDSEGGLVDVDFAVSVPDLEASSIEIPQQQQVVSKAPAFGKPQWFMVILIVLIVSVLVIVFSIELNNYYVENYGEEAEEDEGGIEINTTVTIPELFNLLNYTK